MSINLKEDIKPISYIKTNAADMMKYINEYRNPIIITQNGEARAALIDIDSYQEMRDAFNLLQIIQLSEKDYNRGNYKNADQVFSGLKDRYKSDE
jgi:PHD/YefM family antitoxin component YafN of YafNO toxin-antitoxin module